MVEDNAPGLLGRLRRLLGSALGMVECRIRLFATELEADLLQLGSGLILLMLAALFLAFALLALLAFITVLFWDSHRLLALGLSTLSLFALGGWCASLAARHLRTGKGFLAETRAEFERDRAAFDRSRP